MSLARLKTFWSHLPAFSALMLGFGMFAGDARADRTPTLPTETTPDSSMSSTSNSGEVAIRLDGDNVYLSQDGTAFEPLHLGDTPEALHLKKLLRDAGAEDRPVSVPVGATIVASGGGSGKGFKPKPEGQTSTSGAGKGK
jgi:hypothetical protein